MPPVRITKVMPTAIIAVDGGLADKNNQILLREK